jgi:hypothetical protein
MIANIDHRVANLTKVPLLHQESVQVLHHVLHHVITMYAADGSIARPGPPAKLTYKRCVTASVVPVVYLYIFISSVLMLLNVSIFRIFVLDCR